MKAFFVSNTMPNSQNTQNVTTMEDIASLNIFHQNLCGISNKRNELELYVQNVLTKLDFICVTEHFLNALNAPLFTLTDYVLVSHNTRINKKRGGSLILGHKNRQVIDCTQINKLYKAESFEICCTKDVESGLYICCCYRSPYENNFTIFMTQLEKMLEYFFNKKCILCGDFNIDLLYENKKRTEFLSLLRCYSFKTLIEEATFIRNQSYSCIDNFVTNLDDNYIEEVSLDHNGLADGHAGLFCKLKNQMVMKKNKNNNQMITVEKRMFTKNNNDIFKNKLLGTDWSSMGINTFLSKFHNIFQCSFKKRNRRIVIQNNSAGIKWTTKGLRVSSKMKRVLCVSHGSCHNTILTYKSNYIRLFRKVVKGAKSIAVTDQIQKAKNKSKEIWQVVNRHRNKAKQRSFKRLIVNMDDRIIDDPREVANVFAEHFNNCNHSLDNAEEYNSLFYLKESTDRVNSEMRLTIVTAEEIVKIVGSMPNKTSSGYDDLPISVIKQHIEFLAEPLSAFFNKCFDDGIFPEQLKIAKVIPLHKKGSQTDIKNYRPISVLPTISKIFEKLIKVRLVTHLNRNKVLNKRQFGYQKGVGTAEAICTLIDDVVEKLNQKLKVAGIFLDLSSAFDTVNHTLLLAKMEHYGVRGKVLDLFYSYLTNRKMFVEVKDLNQDNFQKVYHSQLRNVLTGVPQGSILGPVLFLIFTNDLLNLATKICSNMKIVAFADDTNAVVSGGSAEALSDTINTVLESFQLWFLANKLKINTKKTNILLFKSTSRGNDILDVKLNGEKIDIVDSVKFLGVHIDALLNWKNELKAIDGSVSSACYALRSLRDEVSLDILKSVYYALVESRFRYSIQLWGNSYKYNHDRAFILQKRAIRTIVRIPQIESCRQYFQSLSILTVPCLYILTILTSLAKHINNYETKDERQKRESTRNKYIKLKLNSKLNIVKHCTQYQAVKLFNCLPKELKELLYKTTLFKKKLKVFLLEKCFYSVDEFMTHR